MSDTERMANALERLVTLLEFHLGVTDAAIVTVTAGSGTPLVTTSHAIQPNVASATPQPLVCPVHNVEWRRTKSDGTPAKRAYCSKKNDDGSYCDQKGPWQG